VRATPPSSLTQPAQFANGKSVPAEEDDLSPTLTALAKGPARPQPRSLSRRGLGRADTLPCHICSEVPRNADNELTDDADAFGAEPDEVDEVLASLRAL